MKRIAHLWLAAGVLTMLLMSFAAAQSDSLGDYARQVRKQKGQKAAVSKQFEDDTMPKTNDISVVGHATPQASTDDSAKTKAKADDSDNDAQPNADDKSGSKPESQTKSGSAKADSQPKDEAADRDQANKEWQQKFQTQKEQVDLLSRELDVLQREYRLRAVAMYSDAGNRMRNASQWDKEDADYKQKIAAKQKALDDAKQKLEDMKEEARKAGVPASVRE